MNHYSEATKLTSDFDSMQNEYAIEYFFIEEIELMDLADEDINHILQEDYLESIKDYNFVV